MTRYLYTLGGVPLPEPIEISRDFEEAPRQPLRVDVSYMDGMRATDGADISSKRKRREYMRATGAADASDYTGTWAAARKEREQVRSGAAGREERKWAVARAMEKHGRGR